ncbi:MAG: EAL domain-containing protein, partial [Cellulomonas sp.]
MAFIALVCETSRHGPSPAWYWAWLEITETVLVDQPMAIGHLRALQELGVGISIDDFGTGYTSIGQL